MNLLTKDKYRNKIIEQVLYQCEHDQQIIDKQKLIQNYKTNNSRNIKFQSSQMFREISKKKALISDSQDTQRSKRQKLSYQQNIFNQQGQFKQKKTHHKKSKPIQKYQLHLNELKQNKLFNLPEPRCHLNKEKYTYHQKIPIMMVSKQNDSQIFDRIRKNVRDQHFKEANKQNMERTSNKIKNQAKENQNPIISSQGKQKKYRFINASKVAQALKFKNKMQVQQLQENHQVQQQADIKYKPQGHNSNNKQSLAFNQTQRSKGSKQMIDFLQSAREKLFITMKQNSQVNSQQTASRQNKKRQNSNEEYKLNKPFKIQIQISPTNSYQIELNVDSKPRMIAKQFMQKNRSLLSQFKGLKQQKLLQLLSQKIELQITQYKRQWKKRQEAQIKVKYGNMIDRMEVEQMILKQDEQQQCERECRQRQKVDEKERRRVMEKGVRIKVGNMQRKEDKRSVNGKRANNNTKEQYTHVYIDNIDTLGTAGNEQEERVVDSNEGGNMNGGQQKHQQQQHQQQQHQQQPQLQAQAVKENGRRQQSVMKVKKANEQKEAKTLVRLQLQKHMKGNGDNDNDNDKNIISGQVQVQVQVQQQLQLQLRKGHSFNPAHHQQFIAQESKISEIDMKGYFNSPHQLITYRLSTNNQSSEVNTNHFQDSSKQKIIQSFHDQLITHFPFSKSTAEFKSLKKIRQNDKEENQNEFFQKFQGNQNDQQVGALKILSKSRQKLRKTRIQNQNLNQQTQMQIDCSQSQIIQREQCKNKKQQNQRQIKVENNDHKCQAQPINDPSTQQSHSIINPMSEQIISKLGKQKILKSLKQREQQKKQQIIKQKQQKSRQQMKECSFRPKINNLSKSIDENYQKRKKMKIGDLIGKKEMDLDINIDFEVSENIKGKINNEKISNQQNKEALTQNSKKFNQILSKLNSRSNSQQNNRYLSLYQNHKIVEAKKQFIRQKSIEQISFKPEINFISKKIIQTKRNSLANSLCNQFYNNASASLSRHQSTCKKSFDKRNFMFNTHQNCYEEDFYEPKTHHKKRKSLNFSRNIQGLQIGDYLYKQAMRLKKKKQLNMSQSYVQNFKPLQKSQKIMNKIKQKRLFQYFCQILKLDDQDMQAINVQNLILQSSNIDLSEDKFQKQPLKYLVPLLQQLKDLDVGLTLQQFIQSGLKLIDYLSQDQKACFLSKKKAKDNESSTQKYHPEINKLSKQLIQKKQYYHQDIYHRGLVFKKQVKDKMQFDMQNKVRKELQRCTFKPKINGEYQKKSD